VRGTAAPPTATASRLPPLRRSGACGPAARSGGKPPLRAAPRRQGPRSAVPDLTPAGRSVFASSTIVVAGVLVVVDEAAQEVERMAATNDPKAVLRVSDFRLCGPRTPESTADPSLGHRVNPVRSVQRKAYAVGLRRSSCSKGRTFSAHFHDSESLLPPAPAGRDLYPVYICLVT